MSLRDDELNRVLSVKDRNYFSYTKDSNERVARRVVISNSGIPIEVTTSSDSSEQDFADGDVSAVKAIYKTINGVALANSNTTIDESTVIGITRTGGSDGDKIKYNIIGRFEDSSLNFTLNAPIYLDVSGGLTMTAPATGFRTQIGTSLGVGAIQILIQEPIIL